MMKNKHRNIYHNRKLQNLIFVTTMILVVISAGLAAFFLVKSVTEFGTSPLGISAPQFLENLRNPGSSTDQGSSGSPELDALELPQIGAPELTPWDGAGRVTILLLGLDARDWAAGEEYSRSDTMILLTLDPLTRKAGILSIPRDTWASIPGFKHGKINTAYFLGDSNKLPGGGPGLAIKTVEQFLGVPINYYAQIDFGAFVRFIDELGGVKIDIPEKITVDLLGDGSDTKKNLKPGVQVLPGEWTLAYARNRSTGGGDFDRAQRQQQVILAIRDRILDLKMLPTLIAKAPQLYRDLSSGINTNLSVEDVIKLALLAQEVEDDDIIRGAISEEEIIFGQSPDGLSILIPLPDKIQLVRDRVFAGSSSFSPLTPGGIDQQMQAESASLSIYNASQSSSLAADTAEYLQTEGVNVIQVLENGEYRSDTRLIDHTGNPYLTQYLVDLMGIPSQNIVIDFDPTSQSDVDIFLGNDWATNNPIY